MMILTTPSHNRNSRIRFLLAAFTLLVQNKAFVPSIPQSSTRRAATLSKHRLAVTTSPQKNTENNDVKLGHAIDTLNHDYKTILTRNPDFTIYDPSLQCIAPNGNIKLAGLRNYKAALGILHAIVPIVYGECSMQHRVVMMESASKKNTIRIHWHVQAMPRWNAEQPHSLDGISVYHLSPLSGNITQHCIERLLWRPTSAATTFWQHVLQRPETGVAAIPNCVNQQQQTTSTSSTPVTPHAIVEFRPHAGRQPTSVLFSGTGDVSESSFDWEALESRNKSRKKFGLQPLTPEEFTDLQQQIHTLGEEQQRKTSVSKAATPTTTKQPGWWKKVMGTLAEKSKDTCETHFDCDRPLVCCDFGLMKRCCAAGSMVGPQMRLVPVPADTGNERRQGRYYPS